MTAISEVKDVRSDFRANAQVSRGGVLIVTIDGVIPSESPSDASNQITLRAVIDDIAAARRPVMSLNDPYYGSQLMPYRYRVGYAKHRKGVPSGGRSGVMSIDHFTVRVDIFVLRGVRVQRVIEETGKPPREFGPAAEATFGTALTIVFNVFTFQDIRRLPVPGQPLSQNLLYPFYDAFNDELPPTRERQALAYLTVRHIPNGIEFSWIVTEQTLRLQLKNPGDGVSGFAYAVNPLPDFPLSGNRDFLRFDDLLHLQVCGDVRITLLPMKAALSNSARGGMVFPDPIEWAKRRYTRGASSDPSLYRPIVESLFFRLKRVDRLDQLAAPDTIFTVRREGEDIAAAQYGSFAPSGPNFVPWAQAVFDVAIGFIPIVGDLMDFADFNLALRTGKDKWDHEVDNVDLVLMGLAIVPVIGSLFQAFRKGARAAKVVTAMPP